jgi:hypothetical protein
VVKKFVRWFNERFLGFVYYEMDVKKYDMILFGKESYIDFSGEVITEIHKHFEFGQTEMGVETKMKKVINTFEGTPINKIKFVKKYV